MQSMHVLGFDLAGATAQEQGCDAGSDFSFLDLHNQANYASRYYSQKLQVGHM